MYDTYLAHHGILGMKWGVRRYQNKDGTLTPLGKKRLSSNSYQKTSNILNSSKTIAQGTKNIIDQSVTRSKRKAMDNMDVSQMSDKELQAAINRMNLERNYKSLSAEQIGAGRTYAGTILSTAGEVLAIGASAASIALAIHQMKKK